MSLLDLVEVIRNINHGGMGPVQATVAMLVLVKVLQ